MTEDKLAKSHAYFDAVAIDVGAGSGFLSEALLAAGLHVIAIDRSAPMQEEMRRKFMEAIASGMLALRQGESEALPVQDGVADLAMANMYVHHVERPGAAIAEMARALKPGGRLVITDMNYHGLDWVLEQYHDRWPGFHQADVRRWLEEAGLRNVSVRDLEERCDAVSDQTSEVVPVTMFVAVGEK